MATNCPFPTHLSCQQLLPAKWSGFLFGIFRALLEAAPTTTQSHLRLCVTHEKVKALRSMGLAGSCTEKEEHL